MLGFHLQHKLFPDESYHATAIHPAYAQLVEANFLSARGNFPTSEASARLLQTWRNEEFEKLLLDIKLAASRQPGAVTAEDLLFFMYDMAGEGADNFIQVVKKVKGWTLQDGKRHATRSPMPHHRKGATFVSFPAPPKGTSYHDYESETEAIALTHKYMSEADEWVIVTSIEGSLNRFDSFGYLKAPWQPGPRYGPTPEGPSGSWNSNAPKTDERPARTAPAFAAAGRNSKDATAYWDPQVPHNRTRALAGNPRRPGKGLGLHRNERPSRAHPAPHSNRMPRFLHLLSHTRLPPSGSSATCSLSGRSPDALPRC